MDRFPRDVLVPNAGVLHHPGSFFPAVPSSFPALYSQEYYNRIMYGDSMFPYFGNIDPHRIPVHRRFQYEETLILEGHGENDVATPIEAMIAKNLKTKSCWEVEAEDEDGVTKICAVCQDDLCGEENGEIGVLDCGHEYHASCIKNWVVKKNVCPLCNAAAVEVD